MLQPNNPKNDDILVNVNGVISHKSEAKVSPFDSSVQNGDAVWEGLRLYQGRIFRLKQHLARLRRSAQALAYAHIPTDGQIIQELKRTLDANNMTDGVHIRLTLSRGIKYTSGLDPRVNLPGSTLIVLPEHKPPVFNKAGITLKTSGHRRPPSDVLDQHIHSCNQLTSILAKLEANAADADDALMLDTRGFIAETSATHLFFVRDNELHTPTTGACPEGITREAVIELAHDNHIPVHIRDMNLTDAYTADEAFCTGTMGELAPITTIDGRTITPSAGPMTARLSTLFTKLVEREAEPI